MYRDHRPPFDPDRPEDDPVLSLIVGIVTEWPVRDRNGFLAFFDFWRDLPAEERAIFAKSVKPELTDDDVARLAGVSRRSLYRMERYQAFKPRLEDFKGTKQSQRDMA
jgi:hypothetical protein